MKKTLLKKLLIPVGKGIVIFAVFGLCLYAYAQVDFPTNNPEPVTGVVGQLVGFTTSSVNGSQGGYKSANDLCGDGAHICTAEEITRSYVNGNLTIASATSEANGGSWTTPEMYFAWIDNGPPGYTGTLSNDCSGWEESSSSWYGSIWNIRAKNFVINTCDNERRFACCK